MDRTDFVWDELWWQTSVQVDGDRVPLVYAPEGREDGPLEGAEIASVTWVVGNLPMLREAMREPLHSYYEALRTELDGLPQVTSPGEVMGLLHLGELYVHQVSRGGRPYVGFSFECPWDVEHGLGVLMNGTRVVEIGGADTAFLLWIAERDSLIVGSERS